MGVEKKIIKENLQSLTSYYDSIVVEVISFEKPYKIPPEIKEAALSTISLTINRNFKALIQNIKTIEVNQSTANDLIKKVNDIINYPSKTSSIR